MKNWQNIPKIQQNIHEANTSYTNTSLVRVINILLCLSNGLNTSTDIANYCNYSNSTVHRLLNVMKGLNLAIQDTYNHKYYLGPLLSQLISNQTAAHRYLIINAIQEMGRLSDLTEETINLTLLVQYHYVLLHAVPCKHELRIIENNRVYGILFAAGATGKVLLSQLVDEEIKEFLNKIKLPEVTEKSVTDKRVLMAQLNDIRQQGYAVSCGEKISGAMCISAPLLNYEFPAALSVLGPEIRLKPKAADIVVELKHSVRCISDNIDRVFLKGGDNIPVPDKL
jgi:IclR family KDG regulon transcriptional repressor